MNTGISIALVNKLKEAGFPFKESDMSEPNPDIFFDDIGYDFPTLSEIIVGCGDRFYFVSRNKENGLWRATAWTDDKITPTVEDCENVDTAVARLWLAINNKN